MQSHASTIRFRSRRFGVLRSFDQHGRVPLEVRDREDGSGVGLEHRLLIAEAGDSDRQDRTVRRDVGAEPLDVGVGERALPGEALPAHGPCSQAVPLSAVVRWPAGLPNVRERGAQCCCIVEGRHASNGNGLIPPGHLGVGDLIQQRRAADHELWLFLEHFPSTVSDWLLLPANQPSVDLVIDQLSGTAADLRRRGLVHFDAHLANVVTDGSRIALADFGIACSPDFELSEDERHFLFRHPHYDLGIAISYLGLMLALYVQGQPPEVKAEVDRACGIAEGQGRLEVIMGLVEACQRVADIVSLAPEYVDALQRYRDVNSYVHGFITQLQNRPQKDAAYDDGELLARLRAAGAPNLD